MSSPFARHNRSRAERGCCWTECTFGETLRQKTLQFYGTICGRNGLVDPHCTTSSYLGQKAVVVINPLI